MTKIEFNLPDALASQAKGAGLLEQERLEAMIRAQLRKDAGERLGEAMKKLHAANIPPMSMDEINAIVKEVRQERREQDATGR